MAEVLPADGLRRTIGYYYLVRYCPPEYVRDLKKLAGPLRKRLAKQAGMKVGDYFKAAVPRVCQHVVSFHQNTREPDREVVDSLAERALSADRGAKKVIAFQDEMARVAELPARARPENRLHHRRGCQFCVAPCHYGYFTLVSHPPIPMLQALLEAEIEKPVAEQDPLGAAWSFATGHLFRFLGLNGGYVHADHLGNLAYCLLALATTKSRLPFPAEQMAAIQYANQLQIQRMEADATES
jgi:hypothetical protein